FLSLLGGLDALWRELGLGRHKADGRREHVLRNGIEDRAYLVPQRELAGLIRWQIDRHVDIVEVEDGQNALPGRDHLAGASKAVLHASTSGRDEHEIDKN